MKNFSASCFPVSLFFSGIAGGEGIFLSRRTPLSASDSPPLACVCVRTLCWLSRDVSRTTLTELFSLIGIPSEFLEFLLPDNVALMRRI